MKNLLTIALFLSGLSYAQNTRFDLPNWQLFCETTDSLFHDTIEFQAPGNIHSTLFEYLNLSPYHQTTEHGRINSMIENNNWVLFTEFDIPNFDTAKKYELIFEGIDNYGSVYVNDSLVITSDNMFHEHKIQFADLKDGNLQIRIELISPINYNRKYVSSNEFKLPSGSESGSIQVSAYTRKAAYQFGWDWAPRFVTTGIWKPCYIQETQPLFIENFNLITNHIQPEIASIKVDFDLYSDKTFTAIMEFMDFEMMLYLNEGFNHITFFHHISNPKLWYPNGHGAPNIYHENLNILDEKLDKIYSKKVQFGIRKVELINKQDSIGTSFYFKVNDEQVFCKGANYVPSSSFLTDIPNSRIDSLIALVKQANMNMIRVWGGGIYESDYFYETCDKNGIMVWQDFMFANSLYPDQEAFHVSVEREIKEQVMRLRNHPSIILWCGNNEIDVAWKNWGWQKQYNYSTFDSIKIWQHYQYLFEKLIPFTLKKYDDSRSYITSTPQSNWGKPENFNHGAMHYWGVWHGSDNIADFKNNVGRFMVEYGFQSYPDTNTLLKYYGESVFDFENDNFKNLQKSYVGLKQINKEIEINLTNTNDVKMWIYQTQLIQALALKNAIVAHRLKMPHCMGTLFWQLNDCWPGASWSVIDYDLKPKLAYYEVQKWFAPVIAYPQIEKNKLCITLNADSKFSGNFDIYVQSDLEEVYHLEQHLNLEMNAFQSIKLNPISIKKIKKKFGKKNLKLLIQITNQSKNLIFSDTLFI